MDTDVKDDLKDDLEAALNAQIDGYEEPESEPVTTTDEPVEQTDEPEIEPAPSSWTKGVAEKWAELPKEVRAEINRRESDYHKGIAQYKQNAAEMQGLAQVIHQNNDLIQAAGVPAEQAVAYLMAAHRTLTHGTQQQKEQAIATIARDAGIDLSKVAPAAPISPQVQQLMAQNRQLQQFYQQQVTQQQNAVLSEIESFAQDAKNEHFEAVKQDMSVMLQSGMAQSLQEAYEKAVWARPDLRQSLVQKQRTEAEQRAIQATQRQRAKSAAVGVKGSGPSSTGAIPDNASLEDTIAAAIDGII